MQPQTDTQTTPDTPPTSTNSTLDQRVHYTVGLDNQYARKPGRLMWTQDNHIRLLEIDKTSGQDPNVVFDMIPSGIKKVTGLFALVHITINNKTYNVLFSDDVMYDVANTFGLLYMFSAPKDEDTSGVQIWVNKFTANNVPTSYRNVRKIYKYLIIGMIAFVVIIIVVSAIAIGVNSSPPK